MKFAIVLSALVAVAFGSTVPRFGFPEEEEIYKGRVINGQEALVGEAPYIVSLTPSRGGSHFCGGSLIKPDVVLTAAHCMVTNQIYVAAGMHDRNDRNAQIIKVARQVVHKSYGGGVGPNDIALLFLESSFSLTKSVQLVNLPRALPGAYTLGVGKLFGWGKDNSGGLPINLRTVETDIVSAPTCKKLLPSNAPIASSNICSSSRQQGISACNGDSGGPLVKTVDGKTVLVGIVSWGYIPCGSANFPSVYTCTFSHLDWINQNMRN